MQLLLTHFPEFTSVILELVDWISYKVGRDAMWSMDLEDVNTYAELMEEFNSVVKTFSTSIWVWHKVCDPWLFQQPLHCLSFMDRSNLLSEL